MKFEFYPENIIKDLFSQVQNQININKKKHKDYTALQKILFELRCEMMKREKDKIKPVIIKSQIIQLKKTEDWREGVPNLGRD